MRSCPPLRPESSGDDSGDGSDGSPVRGFASDAPPTFPRRNDLPVMTAKREPYVQSEALVLLASRLQPLRTCRRICSPADCHIHTRCKQSSMKHLPVLPPCHQPLVPRPLRRPTAAQPPTQPRAPLRWASDAASQVALRGIGLRVRNCARMNQRANREAWDFFCLRSRIQITPLLGSF